VSVSVNVIILDTLTVSDGVSVSSRVDVITDGKVKTVGDQKIITWSKKLVENKTYVEYTYSIPLVFPELYPLGPIEISYGKSQVFTEARPWFVAADPPISHNFTNDAQSTTGPFSFPHNSNGEDLLIFMFSSKDRVLDASGANAPEFNNVRMTPIGNVTHSGGSPYISAWYLVNPADGEFQVDYAIDSSGDVAVTVLNVDGVDTANPIDGLQVNNSDKGGTTTTTLTVTSDVNDMVLSLIGSQGAGFSEVTQTAHTIVELVDIDVNGSGSGYAVGNYTSTTADKIVQWNKPGGKETVTMAWNINRATQFTTTLDETLTVTLTETLTPSDVITTANTAVVTLTETLTPSDVVSTVTQSTKTLAETLTPSDLITTTLQITTTLDETLSLSDALTTTAQFTRTLDETLSISDVIIIASQLTTTLDETLSISDVIILASQLTTTLDETLTPSDTVNVSRIITLTETLTPSDVITTTTQFTTTLDETLSLSGPHQLHLLRHSLHLILLTY